MGSNTGSGMPCLSRKLWQNFTELSSCRAWGETIKRKLTTAELKNTVTSLGIPAYQLMQNNVYSEGAERGAINLSLQWRHGHKHSSGTHDQSKSKAFLEKHYLKHIPSFTATKENVLFSLFQWHRELAPQRHRGPDWSRAAHEAHENSFLFMHNIEVFFFIEGISFATNMTGATRRLDYEKLCIEGQM